MSVSFCRVFKSLLVFLLISVFATPSQAADITNQADLEAIGAAAAGSYRQTADIELVAYAGGLTNFAGVFNGGNYRITGLDKPLFESLSGNAVVRNVNLDTVAISVVNGDVGAVAGTTTAGSNVTIVNAQTSGGIEVTGTGNSGGLIGKAEGNVQVISSTNTALVAASDGSAGGIVGKSEGTLTVVNSENQNTVASTSGNAGGVAGTTEGVTNISSTENSGAVQSIGLGTSAGGIIGQVKDQTSIVNVSVSGNTSSVNGNSGGVVGKSDTSIEITNAAVTGTSTSVNGDAGGVIAKADVDLVVTDSSGSTTSSVNGNAGGIAATVTGNAVLNEVTSSGASTVNGNAGGLLGQVTGSTAVTGGSVAGNVSTINGDAGGVVAVSTDAVTATEARVQSNVSTINGHAGGVVAVTASTAEVNNSSLTGNVNSINGSAGGIVAAAIGTVTLNTVTVTGDVSSINGETGGAIGGTNGDASLTKVAVNGVVSSINGTSGGLVGYVGDNATIEKSSAVGTASTINNNVGGLVAQVDGNIQVENSYAKVPASTITGSAGGVVGLVGGDLSITNSYATGTTSTILESAGGLAGKVVGNASVTSTWTSGDVSTINGHAGGILGVSGAVTNIANSNTSGDVSSINGNVGGLVGKSGKSVTDQNMTAGVYNLNNEALTQNFENSANINSNTITSISNSSSSGNLSSIGGSVGGLIGSVESTINGTATVVLEIDQTNNVNMNLGVNVEASTETNVNASIAVVISNSFSTSNVSTINGNAGGLVGNVDLDVNLISRSVLDVNSNSNGSLRAITSVVRRVDTSLNLDVRESYSTGTVSTVTGNSGGVVGQSIHDLTETVESSVILVSMGGAEMTVNSVNDNVADHSSRLAISDSFSTSIVDSAVGISDSLYAVIDGSAAVENVIVENVYGVGDDESLLTPIQEIAGLNDYSGLDPSTVANLWSATKVWGNCDAINGGLPFLNAFYNSGPCGSDDVADLVFDFELPVQFFGRASNVDTFLNLLTEGLQNYLVFRDNLDDETLLTKIDLQNKTFLEALIKLPDFLQILDSSEFPATLLIKVPDGKWFKISIASIIEGKSTILSPIEFKKTGIYYFYFVKDGAVDIDENGNIPALPRVRDLIASLMVQVVQE